MIKVGIIGLGYWGPNLVRNFQNNKNWGFEILTKKPLIASKIEVLENNRARSAKLRVGRFIN